MKFLYHGEIQLWDTILFILKDRIFSLNFSTLSLSKTFWNGHPARPLEGKSKNVASDVPIRHKLMDSMRFLETKSTQIFSIRYAAYCMLVLFFVAGFFSRSSTRIILWYLILDSITRTRPGLASKNLCSQFHRKMPISEKSYHMIHDK